MSVKASISLTEHQNEFARSLVEKGRYPSLSAVMQRGLELLEDEMSEKEALRVLLEERMKGPFISMEESDARIEAIIAAKKAEYGLED